MMLHHRPAVWSSICLALAVLTLVIPYSNGAASGGVTRLKQQAQAQHVLEELEHQINTKNKEELSGRELEFYYFKLHDFDKNGMLDGLEIMAAVTHVHPEYDPANTTGGDSGDDGHAHPDPVDWTEEKLLSLLDKIMDEDDQNGDGYVSFIEYMMAYSQEPNGQEPTGQEPTGQEPTGQEPTGQEPTGQEPTGQESDGQEPNGHGQEPSASA